MRLPALLLLAALLFSVAPAVAVEGTVLDAGGVPVVATTLAEGLDRPWAIAELPDGAFLITERPGRLRLLRDGKLSPPIAGVPVVDDRGQGGLLDIALAPDFASSRQIFLTFSEPGADGVGTALARARLAEGGAMLDGLTVIFRVARKTPGPVHFGSRIAFRPDGTLFVTLGERGTRERAQDPFDHAGAVVHLAADGAVPSDNPFADGQAGLPEIWSKGHRNPQGAAWDPLTGRLITVEHGARGGDEVNAPLAGRNYGWPVITYGVDYSGAVIGEGTAKPGYEQPLWYWDPSIAPSSLVVYDGAMFPEWRGDLLVGALKAELVSHLDRDATGNILGEARWFTGAFGRIRDIAVAADGALILATDGGRLIRIARR